jgi:hypothetical protein
MCRVRLLVLAVIMSVMMMGGTLAANAQPMPGAPTCEPWQQEWHTSESGWPYFWWWRWCINYSVAPEYQNWYVDWAGWEWG